MWRRQLLTAFLVTVVLTLGFGVVYPVVVWSISQAAFKSQANGSLVNRDGKVVGSALIGQLFADKDGNPLKQYFQPRPSAAGTGYDPTASSASNLGPSSDRLLAPCLALPADQSHTDGSVACDPNTVPQRAIAYRILNGLPEGALVPVDAVTASGSGLDPDISIANARLQVNRVANERGLDVAVVDQLVKKYTDGRQLVVLGEPGVNVVELNLALDATTP